MQPISYENKYGRVVLTPVTEYMPLAKITFAELPVISDCLFRVEQGEEIALITENRHVQISFPLLCEKGHPQQSLGYLIHHQSASVACVCKVDICPAEIANGLSPQEEIQRIYEASMA
ncbi:hypothetical protein ACNO5E_13490 [Vibrio parahaemolyticus]|uniref:hypothetical protein n=1 Tax=Vibrio parahaemolyticus TaxID=670 RepID=UPI000813AFD4|nr:hypothetical protein [Vibrio parahaemolyticus]OCP68228.1 hypothetical protein AKH08_15535 [Vibrio parahaemolyticus]